MKLIILAILMLLLGAWTGFIICAVLTINKQNDELKHYECNHDCDALYEAYEKGRQDERGERNE